MNGRGARRNINTTIINTYAFYNKHTNEILHYQKSLQILKYVKIRADFEINVFLYLFIVIIYLYLFL